MGPNDRAESEQARQRWEALCAEHRAKYPQANMDAITFTSVASNGLANVNGITIERLSWQTRALGLQMFMNAARADAQPDPVIEIEIDLGLL